jgi:CheY-like chemotaxis protein
MFRSGLAPMGRPAGAFLLLGPTGMGKTRTVEALAIALHGGADKLLRVDCGEFQLDHEVARLTGAPPGYLGHRETQPALSQQALASATTDACALSLVLFDEVEKASPVLLRLLLGVLDKGTLRLGDNSTVDFRDCLIFFTSNLGAREMQRALQPAFGFGPGAKCEEPECVAARLDRVARRAAERRLPPEFLNRIDSIVAFQPLSAGSLSRILDLQIAELLSRLRTRRGGSALTIEVSKSVRSLLLREGTSAEYGARELKRAIHRRLTQTLAGWLDSHEPPAGAALRAEFRDGTVRWTVSAKAAPVGVPCTVLTAAANWDLQSLLEQRFIEAGLSPLAARSAAAVRSVLSSQTPSAAIIDYHLPDGNGVEVAIEIRRRAPEAPVAVMCAAPLPAGEAELAARFKVTEMRKPFLAAAAVDWLRGAVALQSASRGAA